MHNRIEVIRGDITTQHVDAIVNAANNSLLGGGGVDGAIHQAAGPGLLEECRALGGCPTGEAKITKGYNLPADWVIHTVGPVWHGGNENEDEMLARAYKSCLELAELHKMKTIAFPAISIGAYRFPAERAARIAVQEIEQFLEENDSIEKVVLVCFGESAYKYYRKAVERQAEDPLLDFVERSFLLSEERPLPSG
ncbi:MAG: O-acetyl-ADP-ribose deacetylase [Methanotrichaceae archaeon]